jgi:ketosteroid isomerase-like protein
MGHEGIILNNEVEMTHEVRTVQQVHWIRGVGTALLVVMVFAAPGSRVATAQTTARSATPERVAEAAMLKADRDFNKAVADRDMSRFLSLVAEDATFNGSRGREAVGKAWAPFFSADGPRLSWAPTKAESLVAGDVGYTVGTWERRTPAPDGTVKVTHGQYLTVWRKQKDGSWQAAFDTGSTAP